MKNLGPAVTHVHNAMLADPCYMQNRYVDLPAARRLDRVARAYGYQSLTHLRDELERRTTGRVAYGFIPPFIVE
jgi:hypothetical protein